MRCLIIIDDNKCQIELQKLLLDNFDECIIEIKDSHCDFHDDHDFIFTDRQNEFKTENSILILEHNHSVYFTLHKDQLQDDIMAFKWAYINQLQAEFMITFEPDYKLQSLVSHDLTLLANDIIFVECFFHELIIHTYRNEYVVKMTMRHFLHQVKALGCFVQVHRTYAINMNYIYRVDKEYLYMINDETKNEIRISQKYKKDFLQIFRQYLLPYKKNHNH